jgi:hypothetical protein
MSTPLEKAIEARRAATKNNIIDNSIIDNNNELVAQINSGGSGRSVLNGGLIDEVLTKKSSIDNDIIWKPIPKPKAKNVIYDNTESELTAINVQDAIDEVEARVDTAEDNIIDLQTEKLDKSVIAGGLEGQILSKATDADYDTEWIDNYTGELRLIVKNDSGVTIQKGKAVMAVGAVGDRIRVAKAVADGSVSARYILGVASENILNGEEGYINLLGEIKQLNTIAYPIGTVLFIDPNTPGDLTSTEPVSPDLDFSIAIVTRSHATTGRIFVRVWNQGVNLKEVYDVLITTPTNGQALIYEDGLWVNQTLSGEGGPIALDDLTDVIISTATEGEALVYNGTNWVNQLVSGSSVAGNLDGGAADSNYGGLVAVNGGGA